MNRYNNNVIRMFWNEKRLPKAEPRLYWKAKEKKFGECEYCAYKDKCITTERSSKC